MEIEKVLGTAQDAITVKRVYAEPYDRNGITVIPAAAVRGGAGGGTGQDQKGQEGQGGGFGMAGKPAGAYVIKDGKVTWRPAVDPSRVIMTVGAVIIAYLLSRPRPARPRPARARRGRTRH